MDFALDFSDRPGLFAQLAQTEYDLLIIGAGITGCGLARDASMRGLRVALVDANDIAAGTSSRSSKLVHGGMRYLAQGQVGLVREAATERKALRRIAPHLAQPTNMLIPGRSKASLLKFKAAMVAYEKLGQVDRSERHAFWDVEKVRREEPSLISEGLAGAVVYPEYVTDDARLTLANARSARGYGADIATYAAVTEIVVEDGKATGAVVRDPLPGSDHGARIRAKLIVNAAGPWLDAVRTLETKEAAPKLQLTKGIHVVLRHERLPIRSTVIMTTADKRSVFVVPRGEYVYFGTTDTFYPDAEYWPAITQEDVAYLLDAGAKTFECGPFSDDDIVSLWSGVRPLVAQEGKSPSEISRKDEILDGPHGVISIAGGKLTSYRLMAERIADVCEARLGRDHGPTATAEEPLPGGDFVAQGEIESVLRDSGMEETAAAEAARLYGAEASEVYEAGFGPEIEARNAVLREGALRLEDYWVRRSARARFSEDGGVGILEIAARTMGGLLDWNETRQQEEIDACLALRAREMSCVREAIRS